MIGKKASSTKKSTPLSSKKQTSISSFFKPKTPVENAQKTPVENASNLQGNDKQSNTQTLNVNDSNVGQIISSQNHSQESTENHVDLSNDQPPTLKPNQPPTLKPKENVVVPESRKVDDDDEEEDQVFIRPIAKKLKPTVIVDSDDEDQQPSQLSSQLPSTPMTPSLGHFRKNAVTPASAISRPPAPSTVKSTPRFSTPSGNISSSITPSMSRAAKFKERNEERYGWLLEVKDANQNPIGHPDYDPRTLYIPKSAWNKFTPFEKQFWEIKCKHYDTVVFFKKGKFFELFENDADIGHQHFDLKMVDRVNMRMVGVPESSFHHWASQFIAKGYKVAKVEQLENAVGKSIREKQSTSKEDKIIRRELTSVLTTGTLVDGEFLTSDQSSFLMAIKEEKTTPPSFGICFVDTATAEFNVSYFTDDVNRTQFETIITQLKPKELVLEKGNLSKPSLKILKNNLDHSQFNSMVPKLEFWDAEGTLEELNHCYFADGNAMNVDESSSKVNDSWPSAVKYAAENDLSLSAFGGLLYYLRSLKLDKSLLSANNIHQYQPVKAMSSLVLDGQTLMNLEVFNNSFDGSDKGSLFKLINYCTSPFGKRLFRRWVCHPLCSIPAINARFDAIDDFTSLSGVLEDVQSQLRKLPDLERIIARIHSGNCLVKDFVACLAAFGQVSEIMENLKSYRSQVTSSLLSQILEEGWPSTLTDSLEYFAKAFDHKDAVASGKIQLHEGIDEDFDKLRQDVTDLENELESYRKQTERSLQIKIAFRDIGKEVYQFEVASKAKVPNDWIEVSKTQSVSRWYNEKLRSIIKKLLEAKEHCEAGMRDIKARLYEKFDEHFHEWNKVIADLAQIDCLMGLAFCKRNMGEPVCRPEFVQGSESVLELEEMRHPCVMESITTGEYIPNDLCLTGSKESMVLLTGPNMGGKSTLLRQTCIAVILAQLGCYVPATKCRLTPFDRIFTRIGANDNIMAGQSTFMVELSETSKILKEATSKSLVILDELGRGTSTFDGYAIAYSVLHHLVTHVGCLGLFSTHYGTLTNEFEHHPLVALKYMSFYVDQESQQVTFLYKLASGKCPQSYGMNVARMAHIPESIIQAATEIASEFDEKHSFKTADENVIVKLQTLASFNNLMDTTMSPESLHRIWLSLQ